MQTSSYFNFANFLNSIHLYLNKFSYFVSSMPRGEPVSALNNGNKKKEYL